MRKLRRTHILFAIVLIELSLGQLSCRENDFTRAKYEKYILQHFEYARFTKYSDPPEI